jgi:hypothetical protein
MNGVIRKRTGWFDSTGNNSLKSAIDFGELRALVLRMSWAKGRRKL